MRFLCLIILFSTHLSHGQSIDIATGHWPPYLSESLPGGGLAALIVTEAFAQEGIDVNFHYLPWRRNIQDTKFGLYDGSVLWATVPGREEYLIFSDAIVFGANVFFHHKTLKFTNDPSKPLVNLSLGLIAGWSHGNEEGFGVIEIVNLTEQNVLKLFRRRIDVFLENRAAGEFILQTQFQNHDLDLLTHTPTLNPAVHYHLVLSRKRHANSQLISRFNRGLSQLKASGAYDKLCSTFEDNKYSFLCEPHE